MPLGQEALPSADASLFSGDVAWSGLGAGRALEVLSRDVPTEEFQIRGKKEAELFRKASPSVVIVVTDDGFGSGSILSKDGVVLTNWHVVNNYAEVGVILKPSGDVQISSADIIHANVIAVDEVSDLALLELPYLPRPIAPLPLGKPAEIEVGADVHAIGHPTGEAWTYTKGIISQVRPQYEWTGPEGDIHRADIIQTQTPINPGNSGGPLLSDSGNLIGVNSFKAAGAEGLNYAISLTEVTRFLAAPRNPPPTMSSAPRGCEPTVTHAGRDESDSGTIRAIDVDCDGVTDAALFVPDAQSEGLELWVDKNKDGFTDGVVVDLDRDGRWDVSFYDSDYDGVLDLVGEHKSGGVKPESLRRYNSGG